MGIVSVGRMRMGADFLASSSYSSTAPTLSAARKSATTSLFTTAVAASSPVVAARTPAPAVAVDSSTTTAVGGPTVGAGYVVGNCGAEPARRPPDAFGVARYVDAAAGSRYDACIAAEQLAREKRFYDAIASRSAGGADGCGPDVTNVYNSGSQYTGAALRKAWDDCRAAAVAVAATAAPAPVLRPASRVEPAAPLPSVRGGGDPAEAPPVQTSLSPTEAPASSSSTGVLVVTGVAALVAGLVLFLAVR